ncbi:flagellar basal body-associated protein FliL [Paracoccus sp. P2]|uniref:Flagellar protein FliL n=1 Tax=Paracoccus pantotrophus TaxID=82367 RepID=A0A1I5BHK6_PARPN|nr:flagellar basal body-associated FliL family protein [Paracoccus pantotrophus]MDF3852720.1 flagellar basal body-associated FliL family protein [Paracoccus pantotrophus]QFG36670.1 flagellar basal body-associated FliL family protein [Paracoccus pantotrophus]QLH16332.1 flagellar basal body-associated FliL family protein [Paracoccus pantotrophus]RDD97195.1 flagellar basal body protein FliL [Paracoccus pantotrophus]RKS50809.1 flagellar FliL protein [Paracoccus pantotrophus]
MTDVADINAEEKPGGGIGRILLPLGLALVLGGAGFASTWLGFWSPLSLLGPKPEKVQTMTAPAVAFVDIPQIVLTLAGPRGRTLVMTVKIETDQNRRAEVEHLIPRLLDSFNGFLTDIDPAAFEKRGILDIVRDELATRAVFVLGKEAFTDVLITEFRIQ